MITKTIYKCEICGQIHETEQDAQKCENSHVDAEFITYQKFPKTEKYPTELIITMANGHKIQYDYCKPIIVEPSDDPYFTNVNVSRNGNTITLSALGERLPQDELYTWVLLFDTTRSTVTSNSPTVTLSAAMTRIYDIASLVKVKVSSPTVAAGQFVLKDEG